MPPLEGHNDVHRSQRQESNLRPADYKSTALPTELHWLGDLDAAAHDRRSGLLRGGPLGGLLRRGLLRGLRTLRCGFTTHCTHSYQR